MQDLLDVIFSDQFMPHGYCFLWRPELVWLHVIADLVIALAYFSIPLTIYLIIRKRSLEIPFKWIFLMFATFIFLCGLTHIIELISIWKPLYYIEGLVKVLTAAVSLATAIVMFPLIPVLLERFKELQDILEVEKERKQ
ncbi:MAG: hypothetical protein JKY71_09295 [Alphaproteobacteria bacterium]|mgnify:CR=1 FL=1|nr:hypothetical protein [Alphaproteobacteria bacterium]